MARSLSGPAHRIHPSLFSDPEQREEQPMTLYPILMLETTKGKDDDPAAEVLTYHKGRVYPVGRKLFVAFVEHMRVAKPHRPEAAAQTMPEPEHAVHPAESRETKVVGPTTNKPNRRGGRVRP